MCSGTYESQRGMVKLNPQGSTLLFPRRRLSSLQSIPPTLGRISAPESFTYTCCLLLIYLPSNHPIERKELCLLHHAAIP